MTATIPAVGRIDSLTSEQELVLKQVWAEILTYWGTPVTFPEVNLETAKLTSTISRTSHASHHSQKKKRFARFRSTPKPTEAPVGNGNKANPALLPLIVGLLDPLDVEEGFWDMLRIDSPDNLVLRFVRARKFVLKDALTMLGKTFRWRMAESFADKVFLEGDYVAAQAGDMPGLIKQFELGKSIITGRDKQGRPMVVVRPRLHKPSDQNDKEMQQYTILVIEYARLFLVEPIDTCSVIFDLTDFSLSNMDNAPVKFLISAFEAHYPESLGILLIHKAPWVFSSIWAVVKTWLDPVVASKIHFTKTVKDLTQYIDLESVLEEMGGTDTFKYEYTKPNPATDGLVVDDKRRVALEKERRELANRFTTATVAWIQAIDTEESNSFLAEKISLGKQLAANFVALDQYKRYKSVYERMGLLLLAA